MGLGDLEVFAVTIQAKVQMCLRCSGKGQHLQKGRETVFATSHSTGLSFLTRAYVLPRLVMGVQYEECPHLGPMMTTRSCIYGGLAYTNWVYPWEGSWGPQLKWSSQGGDF